MLRKAVQNLRRALLLGLLTTLLLPAVACDPVAMRAPSALPTAPLSLSAKPIGGETTSAPHAPPSNFSASLASGSGQRIEFERISIEQGLSQSVVTSILQDSKGFIWLGTQDGLNRYDGYEFTTFKHDPEDPDSLSDNFILSILEDPSGILWLGTNAGGLNRFDPQTERFAHYQHDPHDSHSLANNTLQSMHQDQQGVIWI